MSTGRHYFIRDVNSTLTEDSRDSKTATQIVSTGRHYFYKTSRRFEMLEKKDIVKTLSKCAGISKSDASYYIDIVFEFLRDSLLHEKSIKLKGFGSFVVRRYDPTKYNTLLKGGKGTSSMGIYNISKPIHRIIFKPACSIKNKFKSCKILERQKNNYDTENKD